ncbi:MAG: GEVED domain-containing protein, partial [Planctomycetaceae bacterium]
PAFNVTGNSNAFSVLVRDNDGALSVSSVTAQVGVTAVDDYGDAPNAFQSGFAGSYPVTLLEDGARHTATGPSLGVERDVEADGIHSGSADADDATGSPDDEDGVTFAATLIASRLSAATGAVDVNLQNADGSSNRLDAWIDFNRDGDWNDPGEQIFSSFDLGISNGVQTLNFSIPQDIGSNVEQGTTYARFRVSTVGGLGVQGAASDGEVEDLMVSVAVSDAFLVDSLSDVSDGDFSSGNFSLREAIELANATPGADEIQFAAGVLGGTITLSGSQLLITDDLTITGPGAPNLTVSGGNSFRVFDLQSSPNVTISGLTISNGRTAAIGQSGGAIRSTGTLQLINSLVTNSRTTGSLAEGGGIFQINGSLIISDSTISGNSTTGESALGGGISSLSGDVQIVNSTIDGNSTSFAVTVGGGVIVRGGDLTVTNSTVSNNHNTGRATREAASLLRTAI